jgi:hypothetical protein
MAGSRLTELTGIIATNTKKVDDFLKAEGQPGLAFDVNAPVDFPVPSSNIEIQQARRAVVNATQELHDLMVGPRETVRWLAWSVSTSSMLCNPVFHVLTHMHGLSSCTVPSIFLRAGKHNS